VGRPAAWQYGKSLRTIEATDVAAYLAANAKPFGIIKRTRKNHRKSPLAEFG
jgi:hypothetical protein